MPFPINTAHRILLESGSLLLLEDNASKIVVDEAIAIDDPLGGATGVSTTPALTFAGQDLNTDPLDLNFDVIPPFTAVQTGEGWLNGTAGGSATDGSYGWWASVRASAIGVRFDPTTYRTASGSLKVSTTDATGRARVFSCRASAGAITADISNMPYLIPVAPGGIYTFTAWVKTSNVAAGGAFIEIVELSSDFVVGTSSVSASLSGTNAAWTQLTVTAQMAATTKYIAIDVQNSVAGNVSDAWFDDLSLYGPGIDIGIPPRQTPIHYEVQIDTANTFDSQ